jgi:hypothetical protein
VFKSHPVDFLIRGNYGIKIGLFLVNVPQKAQQCQCRIPPFVLHKLKFYKKRRDVYRPGLHDPKGNDMLSCQTLILSLIFLRKCALPTGFFRISNDFTPSSTVTSSSVASKADKKITLNSLFVVLSR